MFIRRRKPLNKKYILSINQLFYKVVMICLIVSSVLFIGNEDKAMAVSMNLSSKSFTLEAGKTKTLSVSGTKKKVTWTTSKSSVATVSSAGKVTAKAPGTATIYASVAGKKLSSKVTVVKAKVVSPTVTSITTVPQSESRPMVVGYYAAWSKYSGFTPSKIDANKVTHINYAFANISNDLKITLGYLDIDAANISQLNKLKETNPNLKTIISVGGWSWSGRFSDVALTQRSREVFADSVVDFIVKYGFDGADIDWEYPVGGGLSTNINRSEDKHNFTLLMKTLREKLDAKGKANGKHYILSFAGAAGTWYAAKTELSELSKYVDYANIMTYDIHGTWETYTDFNAPLYSNSHSISVDFGVNSWINAGFPKNKIVMGVPFYGHIYNEVTNYNNGFNQTYSGGVSISYANIVGNYLNGTGYQRFFHSVAKVPWLFNGSTFITYDDEESLTEKANYIKEKGLIGAMIWELSQDSKGQLLNALYQGLE